MGIIGSTIAASTAQPAKLATPALKMLARESTAVAPRKPVQPGPREMLDHCLPSVGKASDERTPQPCSLGLSDGGRPQDAGVDAHQIGSVVCRGVDPDLQSLGCFYVCRSETDAEPAVPARVEWYE